MTDQVENTESVETAPVETSNETVNKTSFIDQITDEEIKDSKSLSNFKDINGLAKSYVNLEKKLGSPKEPESFAPEDYSYELPENYNANEDILNPIKEKAIELGVKPEAFKQLVETFVGKESEILGNMQAKSEAKITEMQEGLKKEWGAAYDHNLKEAENTFQRFASENDQEAFANLSPEGQLAVAKIMHNVGKQIAEPKQGSIGNQQTTLTKENALTKINEIRMSKDLDPNTKEKELAKLYPIAYADQSAESLGIVSSFSSL